MRGTLYHIARLTMITMVVMFAPLPYTIKMGSVLLYLMGVFYLIIFRGDGQWN